MNRPRCAQDAGKACGRCAPARRRLGWDTPGSSSQRCSIRRRASWAEFDELYDFDDAAGRERVPAFSEKRAEWRGFGHGTGFRLHANAGAGELSSDTGCGERFGGDAADSAQYGFDAANGLLRQGRRFAGAADFRAVIPALEQGQVALADDSRWADPPGR